MQRHHLADGALLFDLGDVSPATTALARALAAAVLAAALPGLRDAVPAYRTLLLRFDPCSEAADALPALIERLVATLEVAPAANGRAITLPVRYGGEDGPDLDAVAAHAGLPAAEVVRLHSAASYTVEFVGFSPGFPYLSGLPQALATPRLPSPRTRIPAGSVAIGGSQTGFYPLPSPGGWRLIGRIPSLAFDPARPETLPCAPGDTIRFVPISGPGIDPDAAAALPVPNSLWVAGHNPVGIDPGAVDVGLPMASADAQPSTPLSNTPDRGSPPRHAADLASTTASDRGIPPVAHTLHVIRPGPLATIQDLGRHGWAAYGYATSGALDAPALAIANRLVGNPEGAAAIELSGGTAAFEARADLLIALAGADAGATLDGEPLPPYRARWMRRGALLRLDRPRHGLRTYIAVAGGIATPPVLGSRATDLVAGLGGLDGRPLRQGDILPIGPPPTPAQGWLLPPPVTPTDQDTVILRVVLGPRHDWFDPATLALFAAATFSVTPRSDRTGLRLAGAAILPTHQGSLASEGVTPGAIQIPPDGQPILLLADCRGVGGYPVIAAVISADLPLAGQLPAGARIRFHPLDIAAARAAARASRAAFEALPLRPVPEVAVRCLLEGRSGVGDWRCPRTLACAIARRCTAP